MSVICILRDILKGCDLKNATITEDSFFSYVIIVERSQFEINQMREIMSIK